MEPYSPYEQYAPPRGYKLESHTGWRVCLSLKKDCGFSENHGEKRIVVLVRIMVVPNPQRWPCSTGFKKTRQNKFCLPHISRAHSKMPRNIPWCIYCSRDQKAQTTKGPTGRSNVLLPQDYKIMSCPCTIGGEKRGMGRNLKLHTDTKESVFPKRYHLNWQRLRFNWWEGYCLLHFYSSSQDSAIHEKNWIHCGK